MTLHLSIFFIWYLLASTASFFAYGIDKHKARRSKWRIKEQTLHIFDAIGGWPGGFIGQQFFKHKRKKTAFMAFYWLLVVAHVLFWAVLAYYRSQWPSTK